MALNGNLSGIRTSLKSQRGRSVNPKVSEKGGVSVYGLGRFPVTLHVGINNPRVQPNRLTTTPNAMVTADPFHVPNAITIIPPSRTASIACVIDRAT
jgi:hypothetical protein